MSKSESLKDSVLIPAMKQSTRGKAVGIETGGRVLVGLGLQGMRELTKVIVGLYKGEVLVLNVASRAV